MTDDPSSLFSLDTAAAATNYRDWMLRRFSPWLGQRVVDVGAGIGTFTELLLDREFVLPTDPYPPFVEILKERLGPRLAVDPVQLDLEDPGIMELSRYRIDTVLCSNVMEHVEHDRIALRNIHGMLEPGGRLVMFVPAHPFLYGPVDRELDHYRRYTRKEVREKLAEAGFAIDHLSEMNIMGIPGWFLNNRIQRRTDINPKQVMLYDRWIAPWAERLETLIPPPIGLSILAVGRKP
jgi:2-polyprenyl-3-methyl-5-hydroxy-6-metoxy-1,4-benzoquinol methylase